MPRKRESRELPRCPWSIRRGEIVIATPPPSGASLSLRGCSPQEGYPKSHRHRWGGSPCGALHFSCEELSRDECIAFQLARSAQPHLTVSLWNTPPSRHLSGIRPSHLKRVTASNHVSPSPNLVRILFRTGYKNWCWLRKQSIKLPVASRECSPLHVFQSRSPTFSYRNFANRW